jgi:hypothetical protein
MQVSPTMQVSEGEFGVFYGDYDLHKPYLYIQANIKLLACKMRPTLEALCLRHR